MLPKELEQLKEAEIDKQEYAQLEHDFNFCKQLKSRHFKKDLALVIDDVSEVLAFLTRYHLIDLNIEKWHFKDFDDPETIKTRVNELMHLLARLYVHQLKPATGKIEKEVLPERGRLIDLVKQLEANNLGERRLQYCYNLLGGIRSDFGMMHKKMNAILANVEAREQVKQLFVELRYMLHSSFKKIIELVNHVSYIDSVTDQMNSEVYKIEDHIVREYAVRQILQQDISKKNNALQAGNITIFFLGKEEADAFKAAHPGVEIPAPFDEVNSTRYPKVKELFFAIQKVDDKTNQRLFKYLPIQLRAGKNPSDQQLEAMFQKLFFNKNDYSIIYQDHDGKFYPVMNAKDFNLKVMQFLIFHHFKEENFDKMLNAVVEPFFLTPVDMMAFLNYKSGREASWKLIKRFLKKQYEQGDITAEDMRQIWRFMSVGFEELSKSQDAIAKEVSQGKKPKYITFIKRPYLVHQLMIDIFRIAVFAEARAKSNKEHEMIYTGRESGYEGGNTVAVHGYNNYTKYKRMLSVVMPVLQKEKEELFDHLEGFKAWLVMGLHDAATYDRQNSIAYGAMDKYENSNKKAHNMIGAYILREHQVIKKLFDSETGEIESESEERKDLNMLANIIHNHDYTKIHLDIYNVGTEDFNVIKQLVCFTLSGIADNSAGVGFLDEHDKVCVDPWEEKGSSVFLVTDRPKDLLGRPLTPKSNGEIMFEILENEFNQKDYYKTEKGKAEWATILEIVRANINSMPEGIVKQKLLRGIEDKEFSATSAIWTAGVLNSGFMRFLSYDGVTMRMNIIMDSDINRKLEKNVGENFVFARVTRFLEEYKKYFKGSSSELASRGKLKIHNSDMNGDKLDSIGLDVHIIEMSGIIDMTLIEKASQQLLGILKARYEEPVYNIKAA